MISLPLTRIGNPVLRSQTKALVPADLISASIREVIQKMYFTMRHEQGVGLAANQVGLDLKLFVMECKSNQRYPGSPDIQPAVYGNPKIVKYSKETATDWEGCLSIPGYRGKVPRSLKIEMEALDGEGRKVSIKAEGFAARIIQHEVDHLCGLFYIDRMPDLKTLCHVDEFNQLYQTRISK